MQLIILLVTLLAGALLAAYVARRRQSTVYLLLKAQWGRKKEQRRDIDRVGSFFRYQAHTGYIVDDQTARDLDIDELFARIDHTSSRVGQQALYDRLRHPPATEKEINAFDVRVRAFAEDEPRRLQTQRHLRTLDRPDDYHIVDFLFFRFPPDPSWVKYLWVLQAALLMSVAAIIWTRAAVIPAMILCALNFVLHYKTKQRFHSFYVALGRIGTLYTAARKLAAPPEAIARCKHLMSQLWLFNLNSLFYSEMTLPIGVLIELVKIITLAEVRATYGVCRQFDKYREDLKALYTYVGEIDAAISVASYRASEQTWCTPAPAEKMRLQQVRHPLIDACVPNDITTGRSLFINGTNMSGKTTFIRTVGINVILARAISTCLAQQAELQAYDVYSSIRIADDTTGGVSYYFQELLRLREFVGKPGRPLFLIDEILNGTNIYDRTRIAGSVLSYLEAQAQVMVTSHDVDLAARLKDQFDFYYFTETVNSTGLQFDYHMRPGLSTDRNAVKLLTVLDFPGKIVDGAAD